MSRPKKKPNYDSESLAKSFMAAVAESYLHPSVGEEAPNSSHKQLKLLAEEFSITPLKVRKLLITSGVYETDISNQVNQLHQEGKSLLEIQQITGLSRASVHSYLPYSKIVYKMEEVTLTAERIRKYRSRNRAVESLKEILSYGEIQEIEEVLWNTIVEFEGYPFCTVKGLRYYYTIKGKEIFFTRKEKSVTRATVNVVLEKALELQQNNILITSPKQLGCFGASYLYPIFVRIGIIQN